MTTQTLRSSEDVLVVGGQDVNMGRHTIALDIGNVGGPRQSTWHNPSAANGASTPTEHDDVLAGPEDAKGGCAWLDEAVQWIAANVSTDMTLVVPGWIPSIQQTDGSWENSHQIPGGQLTLQMSTERRDLMMVLLRQWHGQGYKIRLYDGPLVPDDFSGVANRFAGEYQYRTFPKFNWRETKRLVNLYYGPALQYLHGVFLDGYTDAKMGTGVLSSMKYLTRKYPGVEWVAENHRVWDEPNDAAKRKLLGRANFCSIAKSYEYRHDPPPRKRGDDWAWCTHLTPLNETWRRRVDKGKTNERLAAYSQVSQHRSRPRLAIPFAPNWAHNPTRYAESIEIAQKAMDL